MESCWPHIHDLGERGQVSQDTRNLGMFVSFDDFPGAMPQPPCYASLCTSALVRMARGKPERDQIVLCVRND